MTLQRIHGLTFSHLLTNRSLTPGRLTLLLVALRRLHSSVGDPDSQIELDAPQVCSNYLPKIAKRFEKYRSTYMALSQHSSEMYEQLVEMLSRYEREARYQTTAVVHGDPVFSNVLLTGSGDILLLDMRGELGDHLTLQGDVVYDLSKVYQSLLGYDFILLGVPIAERDAELLEELRETFNSFVTEHYPSVLLSDVVKITASHYFGIVPLHQNRDHQLAYLQNCMGLLSSLP